MKRNKRKTLMGLLFLIIMAVRTMNGMSSYVNTFYSYHQLCVVNDNYNPNFANDYAAASTTVNVVWGCLEASIGFGIGGLCPITDLSYAS